MKPIVADSAAMRQAEEIIAQGFAAPTTTATVTAKTIAPPPRVDTIYVPVRQQFA